MAKTKFAESELRFMCATLEERGESILLRSYPTPKDAIPVSQMGQDLFKKELTEFEGPDIDRMSISIAARATSAAPTYFPDVKLNLKEGGKVTFWDGGLLNNNPIDQLWRARLDLVKDNEPAPKVSCVLSLGTSWSEKSPPSMLDYLDVIPLLGRGVKNAIKAAWPWISSGEKSIAFLTNTEAKHLDFARYINRISHRTTDTDAKTQYFRFNTPTKDLYIDMADYKKMDQLADITQNWLKEPDQVRKIEKVAKLLAKTPSKSV
jgi:predicted acylesterase/phospholipase RssA